jgi:hypothetical protein
VLGFNLPSDLPPCSPAAVDTLGVRLITPKTSLTSDAPTNKTGARSGR